MEQPGMPQISKPNGGLLNLIFKRNYDIINHPSVVKNGRPTIRCKSELYQLPTATKFSEFSINKM